MDHYDAVGDALTQHAGFCVEGLIGRGAERVDEGTTPQVVHELGEVLHGVGQFEGAALHALVMCEFYAEFQ